MMNIKYHTRPKTARILTVLLCICCALCSCDSVIYDDEGDCSAYYLVQFKYDYNMKYADAFASEVESVTLYLADTSGGIVWQKTESGSALAEDGYAMTVDVDPGTYSLLVWCGTKDHTSFTVAGASSATSLTCQLERSYDSSGDAYVDTDLDRLFYGYVENQVFPDEEGTHTYTVSLTKDTNHFTVMLQQLSGNTMDADSFTFYITDSNGSMDWDNSLLPDEDITYHAWNTTLAESDIDVSEGTAIAGVNAVVAELTVPRLVTTQNPYLTVVENLTGEEVFSVPLIDYALLVKGYYNESMDDQEYLDRQDEYSMVFFLDENNEWSDAYIYINSWKVVLQDTSL